MMVYRALLIGNSSFTADAGLNPLNAPTKDVARLHRALVDSQTGLFEDEHVRLVTERTWAEIIAEIDGFFAAAQKDDLALLYYSGHGVLDEWNRLFLCARDTRTDRLLATAVSNTRINEFIEQSAVRSTVIILDCCSSGMFKGGADVTRPIAAPGRYILSSTRGALLANDAVSATGTSLFTEHLVAGLLGEARDLDSDGFIDVREIYEYVKGRLASTRQVPHCRFDGDAAVSLARRTPVIGTKPSPPTPRSEPPFALAENVITLRNVDPDERLAPETVEIYPLGDAGIDCVAETSSDWLRAQVVDRWVVIHLEPRPGPNRGKVTVRDRRSGSVQVVRIEAYVRSRPPTPPPPPPVQPTPKPGGRDRPPFPTGGVLAVAGAVTAAVLCAVLLVVDGRPLTGNSRYVARWIDLLYPVVTGPLIGLVASTRAAGRSRATAVFAGVLAGCAAMTLSHYLWAAYRNLDRDFAYHPVWYVGMFSALALLVLSLGLVERARRLNRAPAGLDRHRMRLAIAGVAAGALGAVLVTLSRVDAPYFGRHGNRTLVWPSLELVWPSVTLALILGCLALRPWRRSALAAAAVAAAIQALAQLHLIGLPLYDLHPPHLTLAVAALVSLLLAAGLLAAAARTAGEVSERAVAGVAGGRGPG
jgi:Caspase domain